MFFVFFPQCLMHLEDKLKEIYLKSLVGALLFVVLFCYFFFRYCVYPYTFPRPGRVLVKS